MNEARKSAFDEAVAMLNASRPDLRNYCIAGKFGRVLVDEDNALVVTLEFGRLNRTRHAASTLDVFCTLEAMDSTTRIYKLARIPSRQHGDAVARALGIPQRQMIPTW